MMKVFGGIRTRTFRPLWCLEELNQPYEHHPTPPRSDALKDIYAHGKVPALVTDGHMISDSTAILTYLSDKYQKLTYPCGSIKRAQQDALTHFLLDEMDACLWTAARHSFILPEEHRVPEVKASLKWEFAHAQAELVRRMGNGPFLMGDTMTIADIIATHCGTWATAAKFDITEPKFAEYITRMKSRPAWKRTAALAAKS